MSQFQTHGLERHEAILDGRCGCGQQLRLKQGRGLRAGPARAGLGRRELNQAPGLELQKQRAGGHVFESAGPVAPVPKLAEMTRKGRAMPVGVLRHQGAQLRQIIARERAAPEADRVHCPQLLGHPGPRVQQKMSKLQGQYEILAEIGQGALGKVFKGRDIHLDKIVAIKELQLDNPSALRDEAQVLSDLRHENIVGFRQFFPNGNRWYLVMDYVEGGNLAEWVRTKKLYNGGLGPNSHPQRSPLPDTSGF